MTMKSLRRLACVVAVTLLANAAQAQDKSTESSTAEWTESFSLESCSFSTTGRNEYFVLEPGYRLVLTGVEDDDSVTLTITVLNDTQEVDGVQTRVVEERETGGGGLIEVSRNFFAFCKENGSVFYFGEDVDIYEDGELVGHEGGWRAGENGFRPGLMMPGLALVGSAYYQEYAPTVAMDRARIVSLDTVLETPAGRFEHCLVAEESSPLEPGSHEFKIYAPGIGLIKDESLLLVRYGTDR
jgi:hypothetical protein